MMNTIQSINGAELPISPTTDGYTVTVYDIDSENSNRSAETGVLIRYIIRKDTYKIELAFRGSAENIRSLRDMISTSSLTVVFWDIDRWVTKNMYCSDRSQKLLPVPNCNGWYDFSFSLVEY